MFLLNKEFLSLDEVCSYLNRNKFNFDLSEEADYYQLSSMVSDLVKEDKLKVTIYYGGIVQIEHNREASSVNIQTEDVVREYAEGYFESKTLTRALNNSSGISSEFYYKPFKLSDFQSVHKYNTLSYNYSLVDLGRIYSNDLRFLKSDLDNIYNNEDDNSQKLELARKLFKEQRDEIKVLKSQLADALAIIEINKSDDLNSPLDKILNTDEHSQGFDWHNMDEYIYPPELHLAIMIWEKAYILNEINNQHITDHSQRFNIIAGNIGLDKVIHGGALISRLSKITNPQINKQKDDIKKLKIIKGLNIKSLGDSNPQG